MTVEDDFGCKGSDNVTVSMDSITVRNIYGPKSACIDKEYEYEIIDTSGLLGYDWNADGGAITDGQGTRKIRVLWTREGTNSVSVALTYGNNNCAALLQLLVSVSSALTPGLTANGIIVQSDTLRPCTGMIVVLRTDKGYNTYKWEGQTSYTDSLVVIAAGGGTYRAHVTDGNGCEGVSRIVTIAPRPLPTPGIDIHGDTTFCLGDSVRLCADSGYANYRWNTGSTDRCITVHETGDYFVEVTDEYGCTGLSRLVKVETIPIIKPQISGNDEVCVGGAYEYSCVNDNDGGEYRWRVEGGAITTDSTGNIVKARWGAAGSARVILTRRIGPCEVSVELQVAITDTLRPKLWITGCPCEGDTVEIGATGRYMEYTWPGGVKTPSIRVTSSGIYQVAVVDSNGCEGTSEARQVTFDARPAPVISVDGSTDFCRGDSARLCAPDGYVRYRWLPTGDTARCITVKEGGDYSVVAWVSACCHGTSSPVGITVRPAPKLDPRGPDVVCLGDSCVYKTSPDPSVTLEWVVIGGDLLTAADGDSIIVRWPAEGTGIVRLIVRDRVNPRCADSSDRSIRIGTSIKPTISLSEPGPLCAGDARRLCASSGYVRYLWSPTNETTSCITLSHTSPGTYSYSVTVWSDNCTGTSDPVSVMVVPLPVVVIDGGASFCRGDSATLNATQGYDNYSWYRDGAMVREGRMHSLVVREGGRYSVAVTDGNGCTGISPPVDVTVYPAQKPAIERSGCLLEATTGTAYEWYKDGRKINGAGHRQLLVTEPGSYHVCVTDEHGCRDCSDPVMISGCANTTRLVLDCAPLRDYTVGSIVELPLRMESSTGLDQVQDRSFEAVLRFDGSVLYPRFPVSSMDRDGRAFKARVRGLRGAGQSEGLLIDLPFEVLWGDTACSVVRLDSVKWTDGAITVEYGNLTCEICAELCREGGVRLFRETGSMNLLQNRPNPFNAATVIEYEVIERGETELAVYDGFGRLVAVLGKGAAEPGRYALRYDASTMPSGIYLYVLRTPSHVITKRMEVLK